MVIEKQINDYGSFDITIKDSEKVLTIFLGGDDPNISCRYEQYKRISEISFDILESESEIYPIFEKLYDNIVSGNVLNGNSSNKTTIEMMESQRSHSWYKDIVSSDTITIISDAYPIKCPNVLKIKKTEGKIELEFTKEDGREMGQYKSPNNITINIRQSGSRIYDFCIPFKTLYSDLQNITETKQLDQENKPAVLSKKINEHK